MYYHSDTLILCFGGGRMYFMLLMIFIIAIELLGFKKKIFTPVCCSSKCVGCFVKENIRSSFVSTKHASLVTNLPPKSFHETSPSIKITQM